MAMHQYSFANVNLQLEVFQPSAGATVVLDIEGFAAGENLITCARRAPIATTQFGAYGDMVVSMQRIKAGDLSFPVLMSATENQILQEYANWFQGLAKEGSTKVIPIQAWLTDNMGNDKCTMRNGVILAMPSMVRGQTMNTVTWVISFEEMSFSREQSNFTVA